MRYKMRISLYRRVALIEDIIINAITYDSNSTFCEGWGSRPKAWQEGLLAKLLGSITNSSVAKINFAVPDILYTKTTKTIMRRKNRVSIHILFYFSTKILY